MITSIKSVTASVFGFLFMLFIFILPVILLIIGIWIGAAFQEIISWISGLVTALIFILLIISVLPRARAVTGNLIVIGTYVWGISFWLNCLLLTYAQWGIIGVIIGVLLAGIGVVFTAMLAMIFSGQFMIFLFLILNVVFILGVRSLGYWIESKYKGPTDSVANIDGVLEGS